MKRITLVTLYIITMLQLSFAADTTSLTKDEALRLVLRDAGLTSEQLISFDLEMEKNSRELYYEIEFLDGENHYFYAVRGDGEILKKSIDVLHRGSSAHPAGSLISMDQAKNFSLQYTGWAESETLFKKLELDDEDGQRIYEVKIQKGKEKYELILDAETGDLLKMEKD